MTTTNLSDAEARSIARVLHGIRVRREARLAAEAAAAEASTDERE